MVCSVLYDHWKFTIIRYEGYGLIGGRGVVVSKGRCFLGGGGCTIDEAVDYIRTLRLILKGFSFKDNVKNMPIPRDK